MGLENYEVKELIGKGSYGKVYKGIIKGTCQFVAMKFIEDVKSKKEDWAKEVKILSKVRHPNILQMQDFFDTPQGFCIVAELAQGSLSDVFNNSKGLSEEEVQKIAKLLVGALSYLNSQRIVYRDMKPQNILVFPGGVVKICDFGVARVMSPDTIALRSMIGTPLYAAPELIQGRCYNHTADLWSLGIILYQLFHGQLPFEATSICRLRLMWQMGMDIKYSPNMSSNFKSFLIGLLKMDPRKRLEGSSLLGHPFVSGHCSNVEAREFRANTDASRVGDVALKRKRHMLTPGLISTKPEGCQLLDWLENKSRIIEDVFLVAQDGEALFAIFQPLRDFQRDKDVLTSNQSLNIISNIFDAGATLSSSVICVMYWSLISFITHLIDIKESDYNDLLGKCFRAVKKLLFNYGTWFGINSSSHWIAIVDLFKEVAGCTEVASGNVLYQSIGCIIAIVQASYASEGSINEMLYYAKEICLEDTLLSCLASYGTSLMSGAKTFLWAACEACRAIWSLLTLSEIQSTKDNAFIFPLSSMYCHSSDGRDEFDKPSNGAYYRKITYAVTKQFLVSKATQVAFDCCLSQPVTGVSLVAQIILRCCLHDNSVTAVLCGFPYSLHVTTVVSGGGDDTIISTIFSLLSASHEIDLNGKPDNCDRQISDLCLVLATVAQSLKLLGRNSALLLLTSSPEKQHTRLSDLAKHYSRMQNDRPYVMLAQASIFSLESTTSSISEIALPLIPQSITLCDYIRAILDGTGSKLSIWHGFMDGGVGLLEARLNWDRDPTIQQLCATGFPENIINLLGEENHSLHNHIGLLSPGGVVSTVSLLCHCLTDGSSTFRQLLFTMKCVKLMSGLISDVHLELIRCWSGPGGGKIGVRDIVNAVIKLLEFPFVAPKNGTHNDIKANIEKYIEILLMVGIPGQIVRCLEYVELQDAVRPVAFLYRMTLHQSLVVQFLDHGLLDPVKVRRLLGSSSPTRVTLDILRILKSLPKMGQVRSMVLVIDLHAKILSYEEVVNDKTNLEVIVKDQQKILESWSKSSAFSQELVFYEHIEKADIFPYLRKFLTHEHPYVRKEACYAISEMCRDCDYFHHLLAKHKVISPLVDCYSDQDKNVRFDASYAICNVASCNDLLHEEVARCIPQLAKVMRLSIQNYIIIIEIISEGAMEALLELVVNCSLNPPDPRPDEKESSLDLFLETLADLCVRLPCKQFFRSSVHYPVIKQVCQASKVCTCNMFKDLSD